MKSRESSKQTITIACYYELVMGDSAKKKKTIRFDETVLFFVSF